MTGHFDGDSARDFVYHEWGRKGARLGVCTDDGRHDAMAGAAQSESLALVDVEPDGRDEILFGGTGMTWTAYDVAVWRRGRLLHVTKAHDEPDDPYDQHFSVRTGSDGGLGSAFGCEDRAGGEADELSQISVFRHPHKTGHFRSVGRAYRIQDGKARLVDREKGTLRNDPDRKDRHEVAALAAREVPACDTLR